ncbi:MAG: hypothetical protein ABUL44_04380, partial [Flavobacterium sp.]
LQNGNPNSVGIYCCPWSGWLTVNFNLRKSLENTNNNCPDFEFVEFDMLDFPEWRSEYESNDQTYQTGNTVIQFNHERGDDELNKIFFSYLLPLVTELKGKIKCKILLQFLDSNYSMVLETGY